MFGLVQGIFENPLYGVLTLICCAILYLWREQGKIKAENKKDVDILHEKKLDKEDHETYAKMHKDLHEEGHRQSGIVVNLLEKLANK
ncbi:hypothetical protein [uncultured Ilyobacter sp.]|uniref:hypothetical protein n=1 Tax=uncultured Ilyobacter sp. TaxID=544433 RepID=UPI0029C7BAE0|nr:hypothetical protein [uncultured Ilyobacter sp.]